MRSIFPIRNHTWQPRVFFMAVSFASRPIRASRKRRDARWRRTVLTMFFYRSKDFLRPSSTLTKAMQTSECCVCSILAAWWAFVSDDPWQRISYKLICHMSYLVLWLRCWPSPPLKPFIISPATWKQTVVASQNITDPMQLWGELQPRDVRD